MVAGEAQALAQGKTGGDDAASVVSRERTKALRPQVPGAAGHMTSISSCVEVPLSQKPTYGSVHHRDLTNGWHRDAFCFHRAQALPIEMTVLIS